MKRITKILMLTFIFTMLITSTCFASYSNGTFTDSEITALKDFYKSFMTTKNQTALIDDNIIIIPTSSNTGANAMIYAVGDGTITGQLSTDGTSIKVSTVQRVYARVSTDSYGNSTAVEKDWYNSPYTADLSMSNISYTSTYIYDTEGNQIFPEVQEPEIPDIPAISLPSSDHSKNYYFMYVNNSGSTGLAVFSSNNEIIFNAVVDNNSAYIDFTFTSPMNYSNYVLRDNEWIILENANYDEAGTKNVNIGYKTILSSSFNVYSENGTVFFPQTPNLVEIAGTGLQEMWATIMKAVLVIVIIAVSLLALLILLQVLLKVLRIYLT